MLRVRPPDHKYVLEHRPFKNTFYWIEDELGQYVLNRVFLTRKTYTPDTLATELQTRLNESSIFRPTPGYNVTCEEDLGVLKIERTTALDKTFFLVNDDLLQQLPDVITQTYDQNNGTQSWTLNRNDPKSAMSLLGLGPRSSENATYNDLISLGNSLGNTHSTGALDLRANHCIYLHSPPHADKLQGAGSSGQPFVYRARRRQQWLRQHFDSSTLRPRIGLYAMRRRYIAND